MPVNQKDIARILGVNQTTVSRALKGSPRVSEEMRKKVAELSKKLGYEPDYAASSMSSGETRVISALKLSKHMNDLHSRWMDCLEDEAHARGYRFRLDRMDDIRKLVGERSSDGFIIFGRWDRIDPETMSYVFHTQRPVVFTDCGTDDLADNAVAMDNGGGTAEAVRYLVSLGHSRIAFFGLVQHPVCRERHQGYVREMNECGLTAPTPLTVEHRDWPMEPDETQPYAEELAAAIGAGATAIIASSDISAIGAYKILKGMGLRVPEDISVVGFDDTLLARAFEPPLTTVRQDIQTASELAIRKLIDMIKGVPPTPGAIVPTALVVRGTTAPPPQAASERGTA